MYELMVEDYFAAAHQLRGYKGSCENMHGHNWRVQLTVRTSRLDKTGLGTDFKLLKKTLGTYLAILDHRNLNELSAFAENNPSSENIARWLYNQLSRDTNLQEVQVTRVTVWESDKACASYYQESLPDGDL